MTLIHIVLGKCKPGITQEQKNELVREIKSLKVQPSVKDGRLMGGPSLSTPEERNKGYEFAFVSYHENLAALEDYQSTKEYHRITKTFVFPLTEDVCSFNFAVDSEDEYMCAFNPLPLLARDVLGKEQKQ